MQVYVQKSIRTTFPRSPAVVNGGELSHPVAPLREAISPSTGNFKDVATLLSCAKAALGATIALANSVAIKSLFAFMMIVSTRFVGKQIYPRGSGQRRSVTVDVDHGLGKCLRRFLRQIVPDPARNSPVRILARKFPGIGAWIQMRRAIGIAFHGNGGHGNDRTLRKPLVQIGIFRLAFGQGEPPPIIVDHDADVIRVVE